jgi:phosphatidylinositol alpha-1,6-mannosyltransferase
MTDAPAARKAPARVLLITRNLPPLRGGMERLNKHMALELAREWVVTVVGPVGCGAMLPGLEISEVAARPLWRFFFGAFRRGLAAAKRMRPDIVLAGSGLAAPFAWCAAKYAGARFAVYVHGLDLIAEHPLYRWFWLPFICRADLCIANSENTARLARAIGVPRSHVSIVHPGVDLPAAELAATNDFRARFDLGNRPMLLSVGRLIERKGLLEFVENALPRVVDEVPDSCLVVLGEETPELLHGDSVGLGARIRERAAALGIERNLRFIGPQDDTTLAEAYCAADVHVFPVREVSGDVEGFGMVAVEAAAYGLPTVAFAVGGVPEAVADGVSGNLVPAHDYEHFAQRIIERLRRRGDEDSHRKAREFAQQFAWENFGTKIRRLLVDCVAVKGSN